MRKHQLSLLENAVDSLNEALSKFRQGESEDPKAFKFCILHLAHFFELILKHYVALSHPLLIYSNPFAKNLKQDEAHTITVDDAINFIKNEGGLLSTDFEKDLNWLKRLRNSIEHHKFQMNIEDVKETVGRLMSAVHRFDAEHKNIDLAQFIDSENFEIFNDLADTYQTRLRRALDLVASAEQVAYRGKRHKDWGEIEFRIYKCHECGHDTIIPEESSLTGYRCAFCGNEISDEIEAACGVCGDVWPCGEMSYSDFFDDKKMVYSCPRCSGHPDYMPD